MHAWRNFNNVSFESIMVILYDEGMTTVIHPGHAGTWSQHPFVSGVCFSETHCILVIVIIVIPERSMINATILERRFERRLQTRFDYGY